MSQIDTYSILLEFLIIQLTFERHGLNPAGLLVDFFNRNTVTILPLPYGFLYFKHIVHNTDNTKYVLTDCLSVRLPVSSRLFKFWGVKVLHRL